MIGPALGAVCRFATGAAVEWRCEPYSAAQRIYFANHASHLDFIIIWSALPAGVRRYVRPVAGRDYWEARGIRRYLARDVFRAVLIDRGGKRGSNEAAARASVERIAGEMGQQDSVIVFPEGTRSQDGNVGAFKSGLYHLAAARPDAELIPVYLANLNRILPKGETLPVPMLSRVTFGRPFARCHDEAKADFLVRARTTLQELAETP